MHTIQFFCTWSSQPKSWCYLHTSVFLIFSALRNSDMWQSCLSQCLSLWFIESESLRLEKTSATIQSSHPHTSTASHSIASLSTTSSIDGSATSWAFVLHISALSGRALKLKCRISHNICFHTSEVTAGQLPCLHSQLIALLCSFFLWNHPYETNLNYRTDAPVLGETSLWTEMHQIGEGKVCLAKCRYVTQVPAWGASALVHVKAEHITPVVPVILSPIFLESPGAQVYSCEYRPL